MWWSFVLAPAPMNPTQMACSLMGDMIAAPRDGRVTTTAITTPEGRFTADVAGAAARRSCCCSTAFRSRGTPGASRSRRSARLAIARSRSTVGLFR